MKCIITGGTGFIGKRLARRVLEIGQLRCATGELKDVTEVILDDIVALTPEQLHNEQLDDPRVTMLTDDISRTVDGLDQHIGPLWSSASPDVSVFHLSSIMSGQGEEDFDLCLGVNVDGLRRMVDLFRARGVVPRFVSASSIASLPAGPLAGDLDRFGGATTYGMTKAFSEMFVNDCSRKGFIDGRSARLPTIVPRPGLPNKAATGAFSSIIREPLHGRDFTCPLSLDISQPISGYRTLVEELIGLHDAPAEAILQSCEPTPGAGQPRNALPGDRCVQMQAVTASLKELHEAVQAVAKERGLPLAKVTNEVDESLNALVASMAPVAVDTSRADILGLPKNPPLTTIIEEYIEDYL